jgi:hypothetical protein
MTEEQEQEVEMRVRERLLDERMKRIDQQYKWMQRVCIATTAAALGLVFLDDLVTCEARRIVGQELRK